ncbi:MAG: hypothetical protein ACE5OZ_03540 [Candidatus Heimdallarchaeota archaeon]
MSTNVNHVTTIMVIGNAATFGALLLLLGVVEISMSPAFAIGVTALLGLLFLGSLIILTIFLSVFHKESPFSLSPKNVDSHLSSKGPSLCAQCGEKVFHPYSCIKCSETFCFEHYPKGDHFCGAN